ncbi:enoyl-CoA hydratase [Nakamurella panacisegetis]|uniref:3-hydroxyisobutyryl-CoA hydrolase n=1 Tax=Nakamurella panacisegetis TaxID=1090615 RepID=A0A1H0NK65_9ACTN|nr:enoyl-CoA hydratase/isomerase family protein [Nakamurella panacisegetis]SDO93063.1 enoyl-CoA hydratase [Nakamurella panacisegetis]
MSATAPHVLTRTEGRLGHLTLNRPERINALSPEMIGLASDALAAWQDDPEVDVVLIDGAGPRGLCAGGDIREVYNGMHGHGVAPGRFWAREYEMNALIAHYRKPVVAFMDGLVLGGGVGISAHAGIRVVTERSQVAMPETAIGLSPDVGALYLLARAPGGLGVHCTLTGARLDGPAAIHAGLADHLVDSADLPGLALSLRSGVVPELPAPAPGTHPGWMDTAYVADTVEGILDNLRRDRDPAAGQAADVIAAMSPTALKVALEAVRRARNMTVDEVLGQDLRVCSHFLSHPDFAEGIRAQVIDKDRNPQWSPKELGAVDRAAVLAFFEPVAAV